MVKTKQKVQMPLGIRKKMTAAVSMLLVACIMLVSSTYAWFVLSTAPEVTGITTQVGANGNLEIALLNDETYNDLASIQTAEGDSMDVADKDVKESNVTWGNLIDLKDGAYGLGNLTLAPAELNLTDDTSLGSILLRTPTYGSDGRVASVAANTVTGTYLNNVFTYNEAAYGVRAIGTASSLTVRQTTYRSAISNISSFAEQAKSKANASLTKYGSDLATVMVAIVQGTTSFDIKYKDSFQGMVNTISEANTAVGNGIKQAALAYALSKAGDSSLTDDQVSAMVTALETATVSESDIKTATGLSSLPAEILGAISTYEDTADKIGDAQLALSNISSTATSLSDDEITDIVDSLVVRNNMTICGVAATNDQQTIMDAVIDSYTNGNGLIIEMATGSGVYSNISDACGNYTSKVSAVVTYGDILNNKEVTAYMKTKSLVVDGTQTTNYYLTAALTAIQTIGEPESTATAGTSPITDTYGYALDFAFRTNAAGSKLLLQTDERQRVYADSEASGTQGAGSYMEFNVTSTFDATEVTTLMGAIRVAFVKPTSSGHELLAVGKLDTASADTTSGTSVKAGLYLYEYTYDIAEGLSADMGILNVSDTKIDSAAITELTQNTPESISVIVFIDGNIVDNAMVDNAVHSMTGVLNLQFASDANLTPMENSELRQVVATDIEYTEITQATADDLAAAATALNVASIHSIYEGSDGNYYYSTDGTNRIMVPTTYKNAIDELINGSGS